VRVLWVIGFPLPQVARYLGNKPIPYGGWVSSMIPHVENVPNLKLGVAMRCPVSKPQELVIGSVRYYLVPECGPKGQDVRERDCKTVLDEFKPDLLHVEGTEFAHARTFLRAWQGPHVVSLQGILNAHGPYHYGGLPIGQMLASMRPTDAVVAAALVARKRRFNKRVKAEAATMQMAKYFLGRTTWDRAHAHEMNPAATYYSCRRVLREPFYQYEWDIRAIERHSLFVGNSVSPLKGAHFAVQALALLKRDFPDVKLVIAGPDAHRPSISEYKSIVGYPAYLRRLIKRLRLQNNVEFTGPLQADRMAQAMCSAHSYVLCSTIENSPNTLAEAMALGVPSVSAFVGGASDMARDGEEALFYRDNDPALLAWQVKRIFESDALAEQLSMKARRRALAAHDPARNAHELVLAYHDILSKEMFKAGGALDPNRALPSGRDAARAAVRPAVQRPALPAARQIATSESAKVERATPEVIDVQAVGAPAPFHLGERMVREAAAGVEADLEKLEARQSSDDSHADAGKVAPGSPKPEGAQTAQESRVQGQAPKVQGQEFEVRSHDTVGADAEEAEETAAAKIAALDARLAAAAKARLMAAADAIEIPESGAASTSDTGDAARASERPEAGPSTDASLDSPVLAEDGRGEAGNVDRRTSESRRSGQGERRRHPRPEWQKIPKQHWWQKPRMEKAITEQPPEWFQAVAKPNIQTLPVIEMKLSEPLRLATGDVRMDSDTLAKPLTPGTRDGQPAAAASKPVQADEMGDFDLSDLFAPPGAVGHGPVRESVDVRTPDEIAEAASLLALIERERVEAPVLIEPGESKSAGPIEVVEAQDVVAEDLFAAEMAETASQVSTPAAETRVVASEVVLEPDGRRAECEVARAANDAQTIELAVPVRSLARQARREVRARVDFEKIVAPGDRLPAPEESKLVPVVDAVRLSVPLRSAKVTIRREPRDASVVATGDAAVSPELLKKLAAALSELTEQNASGSGIRTLDSDLQSSPEDRWAAFEQLLDDEIQTPASALSGSGAAASADSRLDEPGASSQEPAEAGLLTRNHVSSESVSEFDLGDLVARDAEREKRGAKPQPQLPKPASDSNVRFIDSGHGAFDPSLPFLRRTGARKQAS
jgi:L-malate glycosyltransferase